MKLRARTGFDFTTSLSAQEILQRTEEFLDEFSRSHPEVLEGHVCSDAHNAFRVDLVVSPMSYTEAERLVLTMGEALVAHFEDSDPTSVEEREIVLAPA